ncbi:MAG TPA: hypothetical protein VMZ03_04870, partial [Chitinophagaceae bacterium]|nr:hypothetical protein [Chitinophagaceae bacterium]
EEVKAPVAVKDEIPVAEVKEIMVMKQEQDHMAPRLIDDLPVVQAPVIDFTDMREREDAAVIHFELEPVNKTEEKILSNTTAVAAGISTVSKMSTAGKTESINSVSKPVPETIKETDAELILSVKDSNPVSAASGGYLARPSNIYAESKAEEITSKRSVEGPVPAPVTASKEEDDLLDLQMQLVERDDIPAADMPLAHQAHPDSHREPLTTEVEDPAMQDETEEQTRRAAERLHKLRNLSFNVNAADPNNEFETVPAYIRRNMELYNNNTQVENFYSNYEVKTDEKNQSHISSINTFLDGKKPD